MDVTAPLYARPRTWTVTRMQYVDLFTWLRGDILVKADKMTMANSLELRVPFLDTEVFAVASWLPTDAEDHPDDDQVRAAARAGPTSCPPHVLNRAKLGLPGADPALARGGECSTGPTRSSTRRRPTI